MAAGGMVADGTVARGVESGIESEVKLDAGAGFALPPLGDVADGVEEVALPGLRMTATYLDTADLRLLRAGVTLRHRLERPDSGSVAGGAVLSDGSVLSVLSEWTLKLPRPSEGPGLTRRELRWDGPLDVLPPDADVLVRPWRRLAPLAPVARLVQVRARTGLRRDGALLVEIDDDVVSVMDGVRLEVRFRQVEVELAGRAPRSLLAAVLERLEAAGARRGDDRPKLERALGGRAAAPPDVVAGVLSRRSTLADAVAAAGASAYLGLSDHCAGVLLDGDPEAAAGATATCRRLSAALRALAPVIAPAWRDEVAGEVRWLAGVLGALDAAARRLAGLEEGCAALAAEDRQAASALVRRAAEACEAARAEAVVALASERYAVLVDRLAVASSAPPVVESSLVVESSPVESSPVESPAGDESVDSAPGDHEGPRLDPAGRARALLPGLVAHAREAVLDKDGPGSGGTGGDGAEEPLGSAAAERARVLGEACRLAVAVGVRPAAPLGSAADTLAERIEALGAAADLTSWLRVNGPAGGPAEALVAGQLLAGASRRSDTAAAAVAVAARRVRRPKLAAWLA